MRPESFRICSSPSEPVIVVMRTTFYLQLSKYLHHSSQPSSFPFLQVPKTAATLDMQGDPSRVAAATESAAGGAPASGIQVIQVRSYVVMPCGRSPSGSATALLNLSMWLCAPFVRSCQNIFIILLHLPMLCAGWCHSIAP